MPSACFLRNVTELDKAASGILDFHGFLHENLQLQFQKKFSLFALICEITGITFKGTSIFQPYENVAVIGSIGHCRIFCRDKKLIYN